MICKYNQFHLKMQIFNKKKKLKGSNDDVLQEKMKEISEEIESEASREISDINIQENKTLLQ